MLAVYQVDVIAQIQHQLRSARHTLRLIERLRADPHRVGPELNDRQRRDTLKALADEWTELDTQLTAQHDCCTDFQTTIAAMLDRLRGGRTARGAAPSSTGPDDSAPAER